MRNRPVGRPAVAAELAYVAERAYVAPSYNKIIFSARMLVLQPEQLLGANEIPAQRKELQGIIWRMTDEDDIKREIDAAIEQVELICRPALEHVPWRLRVWSY